MGMVSTEQAVAIIEATGEAANASSEASTSYWWLLIIAVAPVLITILIGKRKRCMK